MPLSRILIALLGLFGLACILFGAWQARWSGLAISHSERIRRSVLSGFSAGGLLLSVFIIAGLLDSAFNWSFEYLVVIVCITVPLQIMATTGTYVRLGSISAVYQQVSKAVHEKITKNNS